MKTELELKTESVTMPVSPYELEINGEYASALFYEDVEIIDGDDGETKYRYNLYRIDGLKNRPSLIDSIERDVGSWINMAKELEYKKLADAIRDKRNTLLSETDWTQTMDAPLDTDDVEKYKVYRQALRDIPEQGEFPYAVEWPIII